MIFRRHSLFLLVLLFSSVHAEMSADERYTNLMPLLSKDSQDVFIAAKSIQYGAIRDQEILDVAAKRLWDYGDITVASKADDMAWGVLLKALGETGQMRYRPMLEQMAATGKNLVLRKEIAGALDDLNGQAVAPFLPDQVDLEKLRAEMKQMLLASRESSNPRSGFPITKDTPISEVYKKLGYPDAIGAGYGLRGFYGMDLNYYGVGIVRVDNETNTKTRLKGWQVNWSWGEIAHPVIDDTQPNAALAHHIMSAEPRQLLSIANHLKRTNMRDPFLFDTIADRMWLSMNEQDDDGIDALVILVRYFGELADGRYRDVLTDIAQNSINDDVREDAAEALTMLTPSAQAAYQRRPITASLEPLAPKPAIE